MCLQVPGEDGTTYYLRLCGEVDINELPNTGSRSKCSSAGVCVQSGDKLSSAGGRWGGGGGEG